MSYQSYPFLETFHGSGNLPSAFTIIHIHIPSLPLSLLCKSPSFLQSPINKENTIIMSTEQVPVSLPFVGGKKLTPQHPLGPLTADEIKESARIIKALWPSNTNLQFKSISLQEPDKAELVPFLTAEHAGTTTPTIDRRSFVIYYIRNTVSEKHASIDVKSD